MLAKWGPQIKALVNRSPPPSPFTDNLPGLLLSYFIIILLRVEKMEVANWESFPFLESTLLGAVSTCPVWTGARSETPSLWSNSGGAFDSVELGLMWLCCMSRT